jgi:hypothetical protein
VAEHPTTLTLHVRMEPTAVLGLPWFVEVTLANETQGAEYYRLGPCNPTSPPFPVELAFTHGKTHMALPTSGGDRSEGGGGAFNLLPGEARTFVLDISELEPVARLTPGHWQCQATWLMPHEEPRSPDIPVETSAGKASDLAKIDRLRRAGGARSPNWFNFVEMGDAVDARTARQLVSPQARNALAPYLIMHEAVHSPEPLARFAPNELLQFHDTVWESEAALLSYELACARRAPDQSQRRAQLLSRWPGVAFRLAHIDRGLGILTRLRHDYGPKEDRP